MARIKIVGTGSTINGETRKGEDLNGTSEPRS